MQAETSTLDAKRCKLDPSTSKEDGKGEAESTAVEKLIETEDAKVKSDMENANEATPQPKYAVQPAKYEQFYAMIAGFGELSPIPEFEETLQLELGELNQDFMDRIIGFLGYDPRDIFAELEFSTFEPLKQHALKKVIQQEREAKPLFRWAAGRGPRDAPADVACELEEEPDTMRKVHFLNAMARLELNRELNRQANNTQEDRFSSMDIGDLESILEGQFSEEEG